jgi:hypothetical protein
MVRSGVSLPQRPHSIPFQNSTVGERARQLVDQSGDLRNFLCLDAKREHMLSKVSVLHRFHDDSNRRCSLSSCGICCGEKMAEERNMILSVHRTPDAGYDILLFQYGEFLHVGAGDLVRIVFHKQTVH